MRSARVELPPVDTREILRYAGVRGEGDENILRLLNECLDEALPVLSPVVYERELTVAEFYALITGAKESKTLQKSLNGAKSVLLFGCTLGLGIDRLIARYAEVSPVKALLFQAIGAERVEALCDGFCAAWSEGKGVPLSRRYSAGYGDFPLTAQKDILRVLDCEKRGLTLTDGLMLTPTKSVTAVAGVGLTACRTGCESCDKKDCEYRV